MIYILLYNSKKAFKFHMLELLIVLNKMQQVM